MDEPRTLFAWECAMLRRIVTSRGTEIVLVVHGDMAPEGADLPRRPRTWLPLTAMVRRVTRALRAKLEDKVGGCNPDAFAIADDPEPLRDVPRLGVTSAGAPAVSDVAARIRAYDVDVFVGLGVGPQRSDILDVAKYGVWSLRYANDSLGGADSAGYWEVFDASPVTGSELKMCGRGQQIEVTIGRTASATCTASFRRNRNDLYWKASFLLPRKLEEMRRLGADVFLAEVERQESHPSPQSDRLLAEPTLAEEILLVSRIFWRIYSNRIRDFFVASQWILLYDRHADFVPSLGRFRKLVPPRNRFWADPHVLVKDGRYYVFIEELLYRQRKGFISVMEIREDGTPTTPQPVLEEPYHLSNPFVFEHAGQIFMIPESAGNRSVDLYRCVSFPDRWERCETLLSDVYAVDTTVHFHEGKWWLFTNIREHERGSADDDLFLFWSDSLKGGQWKAHPRNPIVSDVTRARPAGNIFEHEGKLYRPAQDCSVRYGYGMRIQEILELSESHYLEREAAYIEPTWDTRIIATHTLSKAGQLVLSDGLQERWELFPAVRGSA